ncbi:CLUMA_CG004269, isoform A [Clunio marinus]|uniref:CLUMA_CG004269, isoform A n=1 Tax=Clunio marinus TaxID=568069 RepID=A0A1J1HVN6_9DIPT|nr:CLUMA_CG004269, isoform A [Clunio marinus]
MSMIYTVKDIGDLDWQLKSVGPTIVLVYFYTNACGPCTPMTPQLNIFARAYGDKLHIVKVDVDNEESAGLVEKYEIQKELLPVFVFIRCGLILGKLHGCDTESLEDYIDGLEPRTPF